VTPTPLAVLLVEDSEADAELVRLQLIREGYNLDIERVQTGAELQAALQRDRLDVVLCDYNLPGFSFGEALEIVNTSGREIPFVILSGTIGEEAVVQALKAGARDCVLKGNLTRLGSVIAREVEETGRRLAQRAAELALRESEERFRRLAENAPDIIFRYAVAPELAVEYLSPAVEQVTGYTQAEYYSDPQLGFKHVHPEDRALHEQALRAPGRDPQVLRWIRKDGQVIWIEQRAVAIHTDDGALVAVEGIARDITEARRTEQQLRQLIIRLVNAQEEERKRIAEDIHDDTIQTMTTVGMRLAILARSLTDQDQLNQLQTFEKTVVESIERLRRLMFELRPRALDQEGLVGGLRAYLEQTRRDFGLRYRIEDQLDGEPAEDTRTIVFRLAQEALNNVRKHANATCVDVTLGAVDGGLLLRVRDDGQGAEPSRFEPNGVPGHLGVTVMQERAEAARGWLRIESVPGRGTTVECWIPTTFAQPTTETPAPA
jgi:PAS domain S-box-containing protein